MRYSLLAPRSYKGRSTSQARWRRTRTRSARRPGRRALLWSLPRPLLQGDQPPCRIPTKGADPLRNSQAGCYHASQPRAPVSLLDCAISQRTVMNNAG